MPDAKIGARLHPYIANSTSRPDTPSDCAAQLERGGSIYGYRDDESRWPEIQDEMIDAMISLEAALAPYLTRL